MQLISDTHMYRRLSVSPATSNDQMKLNSNMHASHAATRLPTLQQHCNTEAKQSEVGACCIACAPSAATARGRANSSGSSVVRECLQMWCYCSRRSACRGETATRAASPRHYRQQHAVGNKHHSATMCKALCMACTQTVIIGATRIITVKAASATQP